MTLSSEIDFLIDVNREIEHRKRLNSDESQRAYYQTHLYEYIIERFGEKPEHIQWSLLPEYQNHNWDGTPDPLMKIITCINEWRWCGIESGKGLSKTWLYARLVLAFLDIWENSIVVTIAPKEEQLKLHVWKEIGKLYPKFNKGNLLTLKLRMSNNPELAEAWTATGFGVGTGAIEQVAQNAAGFHAEHMLFIGEETPGINQKVIDSFISTAGSPHNIIIMGGNPDHQLDNLHKFCKLPNVEHIIMSGFDFPNVVLDNPNYIPGAQSSQGLQRLKDSYGSVTNPLYLSHAKGISPGSTPESLIQMEWIERQKIVYESLIDSEGNLDYDKIKLYNVSLKYENSPSIGVDVANSVSGDEASKTRGIGVVPIEVKSFPCPNANLLGTEIKNDTAIYNINKKNVKVDGVGVGAGTVNELIKYGFNKSDIDFQGAATPVEIAGETESFLNLRSQAWWKTKEGIRLGIIPIPNNPKLIADLMAPKWSLRNGKICIEEKKDIKKRLGRSPNDGDSFAYWYWNNINKGFEPQIRTLGI